jgi:hypothetical protein
MREGANVNAGLHMMDGDGWSVINRFSDFDVPWFGRKYGKLA